MQRRHLLRLLFGMLLTGGPSSSSAQQFPELPTWTYTLIDGSHLTDDCLMCARPPITLPMRGSFQFRFTELYPFSARGEVEEIAFEAGAAPGPHFRIRGKGSFSAAWEMGAWQSLWLDLVIDDGTTNNLCGFTNVSSLVARSWPMWAIQAGQTNPTSFHQFTLQLSAAPFREIWFSTELNFTAGVWNGLDNHISAGDVLSFPPRVVKRNQQLTARLGIQPLVPDLGLQDFDVLPGGEIGFSIPRGIFSETLGWLSPGDLISDQGRVLRTNAQLLRAFAPLPWPGNVGLRALQVLDDGETYFSVSTNFVSPKVGQTIRTGDLLSDRGQLVSTSAQLLNRFGSIDTNSDLALTAVHVWPSGEIWFALDGGFTGTNSESYRRGDLLSDQGYVVYRNLELVSGFQPLEDVPGFGLDGLYVISDAAAFGHTTSGTSVLAPQFTNQPPGSVTLQWQAESRVFQLEEAASLDGPFTAATPMITDRFFVDQGALTNQTKAFYRLRQWW